MDKIYHTKFNWKNTCEAIVIADWLDFKPSSGSLQKDKRVKITNVYTCNKKASKYMKKKLTAVKGCFHISPSILDREYTHTHTHTECELVIIFKSNGHNWHL